MYTVAVSRASQEHGWLGAYAGRFVVFEGPDGSGKSTQFRRLHGAMIGAGVSCTAVREPGGTAVGEAIRGVLLDNAHAGMSVRCEMLLYMASRAELVEREIMPALRAGRAVLADRYVSSTIAYQGAAGGLPVADIAAVARAATTGLVPDVVLLFDIDADRAAARLSPLLDRMESKGRAFHRRVREGYLRQAEADPRRFAVIDAAQAEEAVWGSVLGVLRERAAELPASGPVMRAGGPG